MSLISELPVRQFSKLFFLKIKISIFLIPLPVFLLFCHPEFYFRSVLPCLVGQLLGTAHPHHTTEFCISKKSWTGGKKPERCQERCQQLNPINSLLLVPAKNCMCRLNKPAFHTSEESVAEQSESYGSQKFWTYFCSSFKQLGSVTYSEPSSAWSGAVVVWELRTDNIKSKPPKSRLLFSRRNDLWSFK